MAGTGVRYRTNFRAALLKLTRTICPHLGPVLMTVGPWKPIRLETYGSRISEVDVRANVAESLDATVIVNYTVETAAKVKAVVTVLDPLGKLVIGQSGASVSVTGHAEFGLSKGAYEPWYPVNLGKQPIYAVQVTISDDVRHFFRVLYVGRDLIRRCTLARQCPRHQESEIRLPSRTGRPRRSDRPAWKDFSL